MTISAFFANILIKTAFHPFIKFNILLFSISGMMKKFMRLHNSQEAKQNTFTPSKVAANSHQ